jgi:hypothetical protein
MLEAETIRSFYRNQPLQIPKPWNLSQKHVRLRTLDDRFVKLNKLRDRLNACMHAADIPTCLLLGILVDILLLVTSLYVKHACTRKGESYRHLRNMQARVC